MLSAPDHLAFARDAVDGHTLSLVLAALPDCSSFRLLLDRLPGTSPDTALTALMVLADEPANAKGARLLSADARHDRAPIVIDQWASLPLPHPLDSEFRFTRRTADQLARCLLAATQAGDEILLVGAPTVALALLALGEERCIRFVGPAGSVTDALIAQAGDRLVLGCGPGGSAAAGLLDPPWYDAEVAAMMATCAWACRADAQVVLVHPLAGARPGAGSDVGRYTGVANDLGLEAIGSLGEARYITPLFELAALDQCGVARIEDWRRGGILLFRITNRRAHATPPAGPGTAIELTLAGVRIRLTDPELSGETRLVPVAAGDVFPSVSARAPGRSVANLWTSGNRAYRVDGPAAFAALAAIARSEGLGEYPLTVRRSGESLRLKGFDADLPLIDQLYELVDRELVDARQLVGDGAWLLSAQGWRS